jgi:hypothetical protein
MDRSKYEFGKHSTFNIERPTSNGWDVRGRPA